MLPVALVHELIPVLPFLGDTTNTQALIFSPPISPIESSPSAYPNYTLPPANLSAPAPPSSPPSFSLVIAPTSSSLASGMQTACRINSTSSAGLVVSNDLWLRDNRGWRSQWLVDDLTASTNYTAYVIQDQVKLSGPIYFTTKSRASLLGVLYVRLCLRISNIPLPPCALPSILSVYIIRCSSSLPSIPCIILRLFKSPTEHLRPPSPVYD
jgi:calcium channel MID1